MNGKNDLESGNVPLDKMESNDAKFIGIFRDIDLLESKGKKITNKQVRKMIENCRKRIKELMLEKVWKHADIEDLRIAKSCLEHELEIIELCIKQSLQFESELHGLIDPVEEINSLQEKMPWWKRFFSRREKHDCQQHFMDLFIIKVLLDNVESFRELILERVKGKTVISRRVTRHFNVARKIINDLSCCILYMNRATSDVNFFNIGHELVVSMERVHKHFNANVEICDEEMVELEKSINQLKEFYENKKIFNHDAARSENTVDDVRDNDG